MASVEPRIINEWMAYYRLEPWGDDWEQAAMIAAKIHNANCSEEYRITPQSLIPNEDNRQLFKDQGQGSSLANDWKQRLRIQ